MSPRIEREGESESRRRDARFRRLLAVADMAAASLALSMAVGLSGNGLRYAAVVALPAIVLIAKLLDLYDRDELVLNKTTLDEAPRLFELALLFTAFIWLVEALVVDGALGKREFAGLAALTFGGCLVGRAVARQLGHRSAPPERCLFLGSRDAYALVRRKLATHGPPGVELAGHYELEGPDGEVLVSGRLTELVERHAAHRVVLAPAALDSDAVLDLIREAKASGLKTSLMPRSSEVLGSSVAFDDLHGVTLLAVRRLGLSRSSQALKRGFDLLVAGGTLLLTAPLLLLIALAIKLDSRGPVFFRQTRIGLAGRPFTMLKFRTMIREADQLKAELEHLNEADGLFKISDDPRTTRVGRPLRRLSLDELPQLLNVLRGDMSIVGPRPLVPEDAGRVVGWHRQRLNLPPGMTGHWQVLGSARVPLEEMVVIDYLYLANWSLWSDLKYVVRTIPHVLRGRGL